MKILSIETSCDDTGISIMEAKGGIKNPSFKVLANNVASQISIHSPYGGVYPKLAKREHIKNLPSVLEKTLKDAKLDKKAKPVDLITVTYGPGLEPALWTGIVFAKELARKWKIPLVPVNHMEGHIFSVFPKAGKKNFKVLKINFPALALLVSGGHTELVLMKKWMDYKIIGETLDDAVGEAFDKVARMLELPYPGGPEISRLAEQARKLGYASGLTTRIPLLGNRFSRAVALRRDSLARLPQLSFPRPMLHTKNFDFSYSGLKTAVLYFLKDQQKKHSNILQNDKMKQAIALEFENAAVECLVHKTLRATEKYKIKTLIVGGGVSANLYLRNEITRLRQGFGRARKNLKILFPAPELTGDNSLMIGIAGYVNYLKNRRKTPTPRSIKAIGNLRLK